MLRTLLLYSAACAACTPSPQDGAKRQSSPASGAIMQGSISKTNPEGERLAASSPTGQDVDDRSHAAQGPIPTAISEAENSVPTPEPALPTDSPAEALGRQILSTAFVRVGPDDHLTVELRNGHVLVLRNMVMRSNKYCGVQVVGDSVRSEYCGRYADVVAARPGSIASLQPPILASPNSFDS